MCLGCRRTCRGNPRVAVPGDQASALGGLPSRRNGDSGHRDGCAAARERRSWRRAREIPRHNRHDWRQGGVSGPRARRMWRRHRNIHRQSSRTWRPVPTIGGGVAVEDRHDAPTWRPFARTWRSVRPPRRQGRLIPVPSHDNGSESPPPAARGARSRQRARLWPLAIACAACAASRLAVAVWSACPPNSAASSSAMICPATVSRSVVSLPRAASIRAYVASSPASALVDAASVANPSAPTGASICLYAAAMSWNKSAAPGCQRRRLRLRVDVAHERDAVVRVVVRQKMRMAKLRGSRSRTTA